MVYSKFTFMSAPLLLLSVLLAGAHVTADAKAASPFVHPSVHRTLRAQGTVNLMVTLKTGVANSVNEINSVQFTSRGHRIKALVETLQRNANSSQKSIDTVLSNGRTKFASAQTLWISNQKVIKGARAELLQKLAAVDSILDIREELVIPVPRIDLSSTTSSTSPQDNSTTTDGTGCFLRDKQYGVVKIDAPSVWATGNIGSGVVVGSIDTGVLVTHEALSANWRGSYAWFDPTANNATPYDDHGHGTHTMGTIAGAGGIGVAPGATWITCRACTLTGCTQSDLLACAQFMTCPTDASGNNRDCTKAPRIVSNSWGGGQGGTFFAAAVDAWQAAGIIPIFSNGNSGPECTSANSPGDLANVIAVGATDATDALASFSSKGPSVNGLLKPDVSGPGVNVRSAWNTDETAYTSLSGTSMAAPHVAGTVALLLSKNPLLTYTQIKSLLTTTTDKSTLKATGYTCGGTKDTTFPNNQYGHGRINAFSALKSLGNVSTV